MKVVILAGGFGSRISEESRFKPKPLVEIGGRPILWHIMKIYSYYGYNEFIICAGYKGDLIKDYFYKLRLSESDITFDYTSENVITFHNSKIDPWKVTVVDTGLNSMTGGRIKRIEKYLDEDDLFMFTYGDGLSNVDIKELIKKHKSSDKIATLTAVNPLGRFGVISLKGEEVEDFKEKITAEDEWINGGFFVANKEIFKFIADDSSILEETTLKELANAGKLGAFKHTGFWQPMDTLKERDYLEKLWFGGNAPWKLWD